MKTANEWYFYNVWLIWPALLPGTVFVKNTSLICEGTLNNDDSHPDVCFLINVYENIPCDWQGKTPFIFGNTAHYRQYRYERLFKPCLVCGFDMICQTSNIRRTLVGNKPYHDLPLSQRYEKLIQRLTSSRKQLHANSFQVPSQGNAFTGPTVLTECIPRWWN